MAHLILDRVLETTTTTGTGIITLNGNVAGFRAFSLLGNGNTTDYLIIDEDRNQWEIGIGTYGSSGNTLSRTTVVLSTNSNNAVNFQTGTKYVKITNAASKTITTDNISTYAQPLDADLTAIAALTGTTGLLKKTAANTWTLDTSAYLTGITSGMVTTALGFTPYNATNPSGYYSSGSNASFGTLSASSTVTLSGGTANGVAYLNGSKVLTTGSALTYNGTGLGVGVASATYPIDIAGTNPRIRINETTGYVLTSYVNNVGQFDVGRDSAAGAVSGASYAGFFDLAGNYPILWRINSTEQMRLTSTGLGIGTSSITSGFKLDIEAARALTLLKSTTGTNDVFHRLSNTGGNLSFGLDDSAGSNQTGTAYAAYLWNTANSPLIFAANNTERMRLDASGNLLVGTTSTISGAHVSITNTNAGQAGLGIGNTGGSSLTTAISFRNSNGEVGTIQTNGSATAYNTASDQRLKTDLGLSMSTDVIGNTIIHDFEWKTDGSKSRGVFAQEAYQVKPEAVSVGKDELNDDGLPVHPWGVDYSKYVPDLIVYCQQLRKELNELKQKVN